VKNIIERDVRSEYAGILERLRNHEGSKMAILTHEVSLVQR
jgi:palmitoyltransferase